jgi:hypothetical protein
MRSPLYVVRYTGPFGFIKPWTAVRDGMTFSQAFLTPSILEGMRVKLGVTEILRHRLSHAGISRQQEKVQAVGWSSSRVGGRMALLRQTGVLVRGVMLNPVLHLAFGTQSDAETAATDHLCLCRNEDLVFPVAVDGELIREMTERDFDALPGFEVKEDEGSGTIPLGVNRFTGDSMRGRLIAVARNGEPEP